MATTHARQLAGTLIGDNLIGARGGAQAAVSTSVNPTSDWIAIFSSLRSRKQFEDRTWAEAFGENPLVARGTHTRPERGNQIARHVLPAHRVRQARTKVLAKNAAFKMRPFPLPESALDIMRFLSRAVVPCRYNS